MQAEHPGKQQPDAVQSAERPSADAAPVRHRVVIVDDKADVRMLLTIRLRLDPDIEVVAEGASGADAIARARDSQPDAIILDLEMPGMSGLTAIPILRTIDPRIRILVYSGSDQIDSLVGAARPDGLVYKGDDLRVLIKELKELLREGPSDLLLGDLGRLPLEEAVNAFDGWVGLNIRIREAMAGAKAERSRPEAIQSESDLLALVGIFITMGDSLLRAAQAKASDVHLHFQTRRSVGQAARRALSKIDVNHAAAFHQDWGYEVPVAAVEPLRRLRERLLEQLPVG